MAEESGAAHAAGAGVDPPAAPLVPGTLYVVATPLGNARDLTLRAIEVLRGVDVIAAEDTRVTGPFLRRHGIEGRLLSAHAHNEARRAQEIVALLRAGRTVALVSDAGTPGISDPGARIVRAARAAGCRVVPIPGPSAVAAAVSAAGLAAAGFVFVGFLPSAARARHELLASLASLPLALVLYEAPHRVRRTIAELAEAFAPARTLVVARELTKMFESIERIPLAEALAWLDADPNRERGEFVLIVDAPEQPPVSSAALDTDAQRLLRILLDEMPPARAARALAAWLGVPRDQVYDAAVAMARRTPR